MQTSVNSSLKPMVQPFLGISAKSSNAKVSKPKPQTAMESKKLRYTLQRTAQSLLYDRNALKQHRVCSCHRNVASDGVSLWRKTDGSNARFGNLISCGSVWSCPVCASKITESRREDMQKAQTAWILDGGSCLLMTLTFPHAADMPLVELLEKFSKALDHYKNSRTYKRIFGTATALVAQNARKNKPMKNVVDGEFQRLGTVRSMEVSHGENGWHPHVHEVLFMGDDELLNSTRAKDELTQQWVESLLKSGLGSRDQLSDMYQYAFDIRGGDYVSDYINKFGREPVKLNGWSIAHEVTKSNSKLGKQGRQIGKEFHYTPFQLLGFATDGDDVAAALFKEFSKCFKGKRMNYWTNGLKEWFSINETEDEDLAIESDSPEEPKEELVARIDTFQWQNVLKTNTRAELLIATAKGIDAVNEFLQTLATRPKTHSGLFLDRARPDINRFFH